MSDLSSDIERYVRGKMTPEEMHRLEKKALSDPFLAEALEGASLIDIEIFSSDVKELQQRLTVKNKTVWFTPLRVAASLLLLVAASYFVYWSTQSTETITTASAEKTKNEQKPEEKSKDQTNTEMKAPLASAKANAGVKDTQKETKELLSLNKPVPSPKKESENPIQLEQVTEPAAAAGDVTNVAPPEAESVAAASPGFYKADSVPQTEETIDVLDKANKSVAASQESKSRLKMKITRAEKIPAPAEDQRAISPQPGQTIRGKVTTTDDRSLAGVRVTSKGSGAATKTDADGNYSITSATPVKSLVFSSEGVETSEVDAEGESNVNIQMAAPGKSGEVVVAGSKSEDWNHNDPNVLFASPIAGTRNFNKFLIGSMQYPAAALERKIEGNVLVQFTVKTDSTLSDFKILKSLGFGCDEELVRLIKAGPKWKPLVQNNTEFDSKVKVRLKFTLPK